MKGAGGEGTKINFFGPETARWGGGLPREGVVSKKLVLSLESLSALGFEERNLGCLGYSARMSRTPNENNHLACAPPCAVKTCAVRPVFAWVVRELRQHRGPMNQNAQAQGSNLTLRDEGGSQGRTQKPRQSAHAESTAQQY